MNVTAKVLGKGLQVLAGRAGLTRTVMSAQMIAPDIAALPEKREWTSSVIHVRPALNRRLCSLPPTERARFVRNIMKQEPACIVISGRDVCNELLRGAEAAAITVFKIGTIPKFSRMLAELLASPISLHGVLVQVFGMGVLIIGKSSVGKSEVALDLVLRGHKLVADDVVLVQKSGSQLIGSPVEMGIDLLQIRGLGIVNVRALYGETATTGSSAIGMVVELEEWQVERPDALTGLRERRYRLLGANLPYHKLSVKQGRNMATLVEVAVRNQLLKQQGVYTARDVDKKLRKRLAGCVECK
jgi:HPr kinase/phosphorylase